MGEFRPTRPPASFCMLNKIMSRESNPEAQRVRAILADAKRLAVEYYQLTGIPLGVTGEVAE